jgi:hypothetical protein
MIISAKAFTNMVYTTGNGSPYGTFNTASVRYVKKASGRYPAKTAIPGLVFLDRIATKIPVKPLIGGSKKFPRVTPGHMPTINPVIPPNIGPNNIAARTVPM